MPTWLSFYCVPSSDANLHAIHKQERPSVIIYCSYLRPSQLICPGNRTRALPIACAWRLCIRPHGHTQLKITFYHCQEVVAKEWSDYVISNVATTCEYPPLRACDRTRNTFELSHLYYDVSCCEESARALRNFERAFICQTLWVLAMQHQQTRSRRFMFANHRLMTCELLVTAIWTLSWRLMSALSRDCQSSNSPKWPYVNQFMLL